MTSRQQPGGSDVTAAHPDGSDVMAAPRRRCWRLSSHVSAATSGLCAALSDGRVFRSLPAADAKCEPGQSGAGGALCFANSLVRASLMGVFFLPHSVLRRYFGDVTAEAPAGSEEGRMQKGDDRRAF